ncbi:zinc finger MYM-type protein 1-like [Iris pallida]|uniref:Zinc finger MYM-type protein 1-like n=1 Tax=Iris pallida TaxID=29817 RepID=A0AAX6F5U9_IRIPA|nr:zinc finger MYM-type protein 1-like [Iris pallida]
MVLLPKMHDGNILTYIFQFSLLVLFLCLCSWLFV